MISISEVKAIWDVSVQIRKSVTHKYMGQVIYANAASDIAIVAVTYVSDCEPWIKWDLQPACM